MSTQTEAEKKGAAEADTKATGKSEPDAEATRKAPAPKSKKKSDVLVAVHRVVYGNNQVAPPASFLRASDLSDADLTFLIDSGSVREPTEAEAAVAEAALSDPIG